MSFERLHNRAVVVVSQTLTLALTLATVACEPGPALGTTPTIQPPLPVCFGTLDGTLGRDQLPFVIGASERVRVGENVPVDVTGVAGVGDARVWDLSRPDPATESEGTLTLQDAHGQWFTSSFPQATFAGPLVPGNALLLPLAVDDTGVRVLGAVSHDPDGPGGKTLLVYDVPALLEPFPLAVGVHAQTVSKAVDGTIVGVPVAIQDTTTVDVTAHGRVVLPDLIAEDALRITVRLDRAPVVGVATHQVTHIFVTPCLGEVARFVSPTVPLDQPLPDDFAVAEQVWRLSL
jgi:hypothetical protein